jgi:hypothetical protein
MRTHATRTHTHAHAPPPSPLPLSIGLAQLRGARAGEAARLLARAPLWWQAVYPFSTLRQALDFLAILMSFFSCIYIPYNVGFVRGARGG